MQQHICQNCMYSHHDRHPNLTIWPKALTGVSGLRSANGRRISSGSRNTLESDALAAWKDLQLAGGSGSPAISVLSECLRSRGNTFAPLSILPSCHYTCTPAKPTLNLSSPQSSGLPCNLNYRCFVRAVHIYFTHVRVVINMSGKINGQK